LTGVPGEEIDLGSSKPPRSTSNGVVGAPSFLLLRKPTDDDSLRADLGSGCAVAVEPITGDQNYDELPRRYAGAKLLISVSTETAFRCALSNALATALSTRLAPRVVALDDLEMATQEAIGNAVLHGNLALPVLSVSNLAALESRVQEIEQRLRDPVFACRRVTIACDWGDGWLQVAVYDEGDGFAAPPRGGAPPAAGGGRGLAMMRELAVDVAFDLDGRCVRMRFPTAKSALGP